VTTGSFKRLNGLRSLGRTVVVWKNVAFFSKRRACQEFLTNLGLFGQGFLTKTLFIVLGAEVEYETIGAI
jgi:hypothetical protein